MTGAGGFIGSHLTEYLTQKGFQVKAFVRYNSKSNWGWLEESPYKDRIEVYTGDIRDFDSVNEAVTFSLKKDENSSRKYSLLFDLKPDTKYLLEVDSGMIKTYSGLYNAGFSTKFETQKKDYYGTIVINQQNPNGPGN